MTESSLPGFAADVERADLLNALQLICRVVERRNTIPIMANVRLVATRDALQLYATDLDLALSLSIPARGPDAGNASAAVTCDAGGLLAVVKAAAKGAAIMLGVTGDRLAVVSGRARHALTMLPADDYPTLVGTPDGAELARFTVDAAQLQRDLARLAPFMSTEETRYYLQGVAVSVAPVDDNPAALQLVATDGSNLVRIVRDVAAGAETLPAVPLIVPRKAIDLIGRLIGPKPGKVAAGDVALSFGAASVAVELGSACLVAKLIDGTYPDVDAAWRRALASGLQREAFPELNDALPAAVLAKLAKSGGAVTVDVGDTAALVGFPGAPEAAAIVALLDSAAAGSGKFLHATSDAGQARAVGYLHDLAMSRGLAADAWTWGDWCDLRQYRESITQRRADIYPPCLRFRGQEIAGATFGFVVEYGGVRDVERVDYAALVVTVDKVKVPDRYADGSFSVAMPRERALMAAAVTLDSGDGERSLRTSDAGALQLSADQVRALAGVVDTTPNPALQRSWDAIGERWMRPAVKSRAKRSTEAEQRAACLVDPVGVMAALKAERIARHIVDVDAVSAVPVASPVAVIAPVIIAPVAVAPVVIAPVAVEALASPLSVVAPVAALSAPPVADVPAMPTPVDDAGGLAATVAALLQRVAALEAERTAPAAAPVEVAPHAPPGFTREQWEAELARRAGVELERDQLAVQLAEMTAERDAARAERDTARAELATAGARIVGLEAETRRLRIATPLAGLRYTGGHTGAFVQPRRPSAPPSTSIMPRLVATGGLRIAAE